MYLPGIFLFFSDELITAPINQKIAQIVSQLKLSPALDLCSQRGHKCKYLNDRGVKAFGIDINAKLLHSRPKSLKTQPLICGDVLHLPFKDNSVKVAVLTFALHDKKKEERGLILKELKRTLCHEGKIIITDFEAPWNIISFLGFGLIIIKELFSGHMKNAISFFNSGGIMQLIELQHAYCILKKRISFPPITINVVSFEPISNM